MNNYGPEFVLAAFELGYSEKDIDAVSLEQIYKQSYEIVKKMALNQKDFYLYKKLKIYEARRQRIVKEIQNKCEQNRRQKQTKTLPIKLRQIYSEHQKRIEKNKKYKQTLIRGLESSGKSRKKNQISNTIDFARKSPQQMNNSHRGMKLRSSSQSRSSKQSSRSSASQKSNRSKLSGIQQNQSQIKLRLSQVRQKQRNIQEYKKKLLKQKLKRDEIKLLKAEQNNLHKSQKAKARSQISRKIINENRKQIEVMKNFDLKNHYQNFKFKLEKTDFNRSRNTKSIQQNKKKIKQTGSFVHFIKEQQKQLSSGKNQKYRYDQKMKMAEERLKDIHNLKKKSISQSIKKKQTRSFMVEDNRDIRFKQKRIKNAQLIFWEQKKHEYAGQRRFQSRQEQRMNLLSQNICRQVALQNYKSMKLGQQRKNKNEQIRLKQKLKNVQDMQKLKKILKDKQKEKFGKVYIDFNQNHKSNTDQNKIGSIVRNKFYTMNLKEMNNQQPATRNSFTSNQNNRNNMLNKVFV